jgi:hypothetical protein
MTRKAIPLGDVEETACHNHEAAAPGKKDPRRQWLDRSQALLKTIEALEDAPTHDQDDRVPVPATQVNMVRNRPSFMLE